jgi:hypothetical protein
MIQHAYYLCTRYLQYVHEIWLAELTKRDTTCQTEYETSKVRVSRGKIQWSTNNVAKTK